MSATIGVESVAASMASAMALAEMLRIGGPARMMSRSSTITESAGNRPLDFSSTYLAISELAKPKLASRANSVSATGVSCPASSPGAAHVVHAADRHAAGVGECGNNHDAVGRLAVDGGDGGRDDVRFERVVAAEGGVAAADEAEPQGRVSRCGGREGVPDDFLVAGRRLCRVKAAGVGQHVDRALALAVDFVGEGPGEVGHFPAGEDRKVRHGLGAGGVVVEHYQDTGGCLGRGSHAVCH